MGKPLILHCLDGLGIGGAERELVLLLRYGPAELFDHVVCHIGPASDLAPEIRALGIPVYDLSERRRFSLGALLRLLRLVRRLRPALIHADHRYGKLYARAVSRVLRIPLLATMGLRVSGPGFGPLRTAPIRWVSFGAERLGSLLLTDHTVAISEDIRDLLLHQGLSASRISVVRRGLALEDLPHMDPWERAALRTNLDLEETAPVLMNVARLIDRKGQEQLIEALPAVRRRHPRATLVLVGDGPNRSRYAALAAARGVAAAVRFLGIRRDVFRLLQLADLFVFPSLQEGTGVALLEAMAAARPCVVSDIPIFREVLGTGEAGCFVPLNRPDLLAEALIQLLDEPERGRAMGQQARAVVEERFDIRRNALEFARICQRVIAQSAARRKAGRHTSTKRGREPSRRRRTQGPRAASSR